MTTPSSGKKNKKYKLIKVVDGEAAPPCAFFNSPQGCKNGDKCKFAHIRIGSKPSVVKDDDNSSSCVSVSSESSGISSESDGEVPEVQFPVTTPSGTQKKRQRPAIEVQTPIALKKAKKQDNSSKLVQKKLAKTKKHEQKSKSSETSHSFRDLALPIKPFSVMGKTKSTVDNDTVSSDESVESVVQKDILPTSSSEGMKWSQAILASRKHSRYGSVYDFDKQKNTDEEHGRISTPTNDIPDKWVKARPHGKWCAKNPQAIVIDCEMCETQDPKTGATDPKALCRLSVVNAVNPEETLIDTLVKPHWPVKDDRARINGIKKDALDNVEFTLQHAQAFMLALCSQETVIIGHAVHNDLVSLKMEHYCNVDSSFLFPTQDGEDSEPSDAPCSLKDLADQVLKVDMPDVHDSVNDCKMTLKCLEEGYIKTGGNPITIMRAPRKSNRAKTLVVHKIPRKCTADDITEMFVTLTYVKPKEVTEIAFKNDYGKTEVIFSSVGHANLAFNTLESDHVRIDKGGYKGKRIYLEGGGYIETRKNVKERQDKDQKNKDD